LERFLKKAAKYFKKKVFIESKKIVNLFAHVPKKWNTSLLLTIAKYSEQLMISRRTRIIHSKELMMHFCYKTSENKQ